MRKSLLVLLVLLTAAPFALPKKKRKRRKLPTVTFVSETKCKANHGVWRWKVKTDPDRPPARIAADHKVTVADVGAWDPPEEKVKIRTPRKGREKEWYELTGKVVLVKAEQDGDLHVQLGDPTGKSKLEVVVEVPVDNDDPDSAWSKMRKVVFGWSDQTFPFTTKTGHRLTLTRKPVVRVVGKAFWDAVHQKKATPNRRRDHANVTVWEIHPMSSTIAYL
jgi:hypothetical protein